jgi:prepilin-type N-terminal cleavage/methylation domain-containing protein
MKRNRGFTLIEVLVVIAIIGITSSVILGSVNDARETAKVKSTVLQVRELEKAIFLYFNDIRQYPTPCDNQCTIDALRTSDVLTLWNGPYFGADWVTLRHPWGGHLSFFMGDFDADTIMDPVIAWNDDAPESPYSDNSGALSLTTMQAIDSVLDDGNLATGKVRQSMSTAGELLYKIEF